MESIEEQAARWAVRAMAGDFGTKEQRELERWLSADLRHRGAYVLARAQWVDLDRLATLNGPASAADDNLDCGRVSSQGYAAGYVSDRPGISRREVLAASAAAVVLVGGGLSQFLLREGPTRYVSGIGEVRRISLEDGSTLVLNTATAVTVELGKLQRNIHLLRGEALFEVAHDEARPFVVFARDATVRAVGTAFDVRLESTQVDVTVTEGVVEVALAELRGLGDSGSMILAENLKRISANELVVIAGTRAPQISRVPAAQVHRLLAWREGMVSFDGESLGRAVAEINRHNRREIIVDDPTLARKPIVGVFRADDPASFAAAAAATLKATVIVNGDTIRLEPNGSPAQ